MNSTINRDTSDREIVITRVLSAPRELVYEAWTNPEHLNHWYGPNGFTITNKEWDFRAGGSWRFTMHGPDGRDYPNKIIFLEIVKPELIVYKHAGDEETEPVNFHVTVTFEVSGNNTKLKMISVFDSKEDLDRVEKEYGAIEGGKQTVNRLEQYLLQLQHASKAN
ncbi:MAG TPA: SRPBCC family protein [Chitinophagaceae bacterium]